jgi:hypothetical protein
MILDIEHMFVLYLSRGTMANVTRQDGYQRRY